MLERSQPQHQQTDRYQLRKTVAELEGGQEALDRVKQRKKTGNYITKLLKMFHIGRGEEGAGSAASAEAGTTLASTNASAERADARTANPAVDQEGGKHAASIERDQGGYQARHTKSEELPTIDVDWVEGQKELATSAQQDEYNPNENPDVIGSDAWFRERDEAAEPSAELTALRTYRGATEITPSEADDQEPTVTANKHVRAWRLEDQPRMIELPRHREEAEAAQNSVTNLIQRQPTAQRSGRHRRAA